MSCFYNKALTENPFPQKTKLQSLHLQVGRCILFVYMEHGVLLSTRCVNMSMALPNWKLSLFAFCLTQTAFLLLTQTLNSGHSQTHHIHLSIKKGVTYLSIWMKTLELILSAPQAVSQRNDKRTRQNCNLGAQLAYSWSAAETAVRQKTAQKINMEMAQDTDIPPSSSDFLGTSQQSQWQANSLLSLPLFRFVFSEAVRIFLFTSARPALPTDQLSWGEFSCCPLPVIRALQSQT